MKENAVLIIGAGASGCAAAIKLLDNGFTNVQILEAEHRIGGRIDTRPFAANVVDMGAQWCHGKEDNVVYALGKDSNIFSSNSARYDRMELRKSNGCSVNRNDSDHLMDLMTSIFDATELKGKSIPLGQYITHKYKSQLQHSHTNCRNIDGELQNQFLDFFRKLESSFDGYDNWHNVSCDAYTDYHNCIGDPLLNWRDCGYKTLFDLLERYANSHIELSSHILLGKHVVCIDYNCTDNDNQPFVRVKCADGSAYEAKHIICTISLGVLKATHLNLFRPELPAAKRIAIDSLSMGACGKIFIEFESRFWRTEHWHGFGLIWESSDALTRAIEVTKAKWLNGVFRFLCVDFQTNVLCVRIAGTEATHEMEMATDGEIIDTISYLLRTFCPDFHASNIIRIVKSNWYSNQNFRGSYSYHSVGYTESNQSNTETLAEPVLDTNQEHPLILFAGEATHRHYFSTVHGAVESGWREADRLIDYYKESISLVQQIENMKMQIATDLQVMNKEISDSSLSHRHVDVLILGAGLSGLGAATAINRANADVQRATGKQYSFLILEGQARGGGRVNTVALTEYEQNRRIIDNAIECNANRKCFEWNMVDGGAQWLHGKYNVLHDISEKYQLLSDEQSEEGLGAFLYENGVEIDPFLVKKIDFVVGEILGECELFAQDTATWTESNDHPSYPKSVEHFMRERFQRYLKNVECPTERRIASDLFDWHIRFQIIDNSCMSLRDVSAKHWGKYSFNGESCQAHYNFRNGFGHIVNKLIEDLDENCVLFKKEIVRITVNGDVENSDRPKISVKCGDHSVYTANHVIVTFSLGVLKTNHMEMFEPQLPMFMRHAIDSIGFETINKLFLQFETAWWGDINGIQLIFKNDDLNNCHWTRYLTGFDVLSPGTPNTLLGWIGGYGAVEMEQLSDDEIIDDCIKLLSKFTKIEVPTPIKFFCTRWHSNAFVRGAYSYISTECDQNDTILSSLTQPLELNDFFPSNDNSRAATDADRPIDAPIMLFAGEACHQQYFSTAHGAFHSGMEQMEKILAFYN